MITVLPGQRLSLRFAKGVHKRTTRYERANNTSGGAGPSIGVEVRTGIRLKIPDAVNV